MYVAFKRPRPVGAAISDRARAAPPARHVAANINNAANSSADEWSGSRTILVPSAARTVGAHAT